MTGLPRVRVQRDRVERAAPAGARRSRAAPAQLRVRQARRGSRARRGSAAAQRARGRRAAGARTTSRTAASTSSAVEVRLVPDLPGADRPRRELRVLGPQRSACGRSGDERLQEGPKSASSRGGDARSAGPAAAQAACPSTTGTHAEARAARPPARWRRRRRSRALRARLAAPCAHVERVAHGRRRRCRRAACPLAAVRSPPSPITAPSGDDAEPVARHGGRRPGAAAAGAAARASTTRAIEGPRHGPSSAAMRATP